jgi:hypothetical protein
MIRTPSPRWMSSTKSDKFGNFSASRCINLDVDGYIRSSSRAFSVYTEDPNITGFDATATNVLAIGRYGRGDFTAVTQNANQDIELDDNTVDGIEDEEANNANTTSNSWGTFWQNRWYVSDATAVVYKAISGGPGGAWTTGIITGLTSGVTHCLEVFKNRNSLCVSNGNVVKQYNTSHTNTTDLTIPADYEIIGLAYSGNRMGVITRLASTLEGQGTDAYFFVWDGASTSASTGVPIGSDAAVGIVAYKGTWVVLTRTGQLLMWNGGGFDEIAAFPVYSTQYSWGDFINKNAFGQCMTVEGDNIYINVDMTMDAFGKYRQTALPYCHSGIWCFDPSVGLYHRYGASISPMHVITVAQADVNTSTNVLTTSSAVPETGTVLRYSESSTATTIAGLALYSDYYIIKLTSTTFKLASTYADAIAGTAIDITGTGSAFNYFFAFPVLDYNQAVIDAGGALTTIGTYEQWGDHMIFGSKVYDHDSENSYNHFMVTVPDLENRSYFVTPKYFAQGNTDSNQKFVLRHKKLTGTDAIIVREKSMDATDLPITTGVVTWSSSTEFSTTSNLAPLLAAYEANIQTECEITAGFGSGWIAHVSSVAYGAGTYSVTLAEAIPGAESGKKSRVQFDNFAEAARITADTQSDDGVFSCPIGTSGRFTQYKIELRGVNVIIEDASLVSVPHKLPA